MFKTISNWFNRIVASDSKHIDNEQEKQEQLYTIEDAKAILTSRGYAIVNARMFESLTKYNERYHLMWDEAEKRCEKLRNELIQYKQMYADEVQKRVDLIEHLGSTNSK